MKVSVAYTEIFNLVNAAKWHKENCHSGCDVSLVLLKSAAISLLYRCTPSEVKEVEQLIEEANCWM